jgi:hypothetical protein
LYIDVALLSETHPKLHERFYIPNYHTDCLPGRKGGTAIAVRKDIHHNHVCLDLPHLLLIEATGVCIMIGNNEVPLAAVYKSPSHNWNDADIQKSLNS